MRLFLLLLGALRPLALSTAAVGPRVAAVHARSGPIVAQTRNAVGGKAGVLGDLQGLWNRLAGASPSARDLAEQENLMANTLEAAPLVLVVGASGRTGQIIVGKLLVRGFRVAALVRSLTTDTLNLLGSGVSYCYGDMTDYRSLLDAMEDVDKVVFVASVEADREAEAEGIRNVVRAFQDTRTFTYGDAEATKLSLFKFKKDSHFDSWAVNANGVSAADEQLARAGLAPRPPVAYWKRSDAHSNGVFVGTVYDKLLGSSLVTCDLRAAPAAQVTSRLPAGTPLQDAGESALQLADFSGLVLRAIGDGQKYAFVIRTSLYETSGIEYHADFKTNNGTFTTASLPFTKFAPYKNGQPVEATEERKLDRRDLREFGVGFFPRRNNPRVVNGSFYLSLTHIKAFRERDEPEFVYVSPSAAARDLGDAADGGEADTSEEGEDDWLKVGLQCEGLLRSSGLTYFILRPGMLNDMPGGIRPLAFQQGPVPPQQSVSRADVAEVVVRSLLDTRACNVACTITEAK